MKSLDFFKKHVVFRGEVGCRVRWAAVCRQGPTGPTGTVEPEAQWNPPHIHGFFECVMYAMDVLNNCVN